jgi:hypothetical protein
MNAIKKTSSQRNAKARSSVARGSGLFVVIDFGGRCGDSIPKGSNPTKLHTTREAAKTEATRLSAANIGRSFAVFACEGFASSPTPKPAWRKLAKSDYAPTEMQW